ncbi:MAG: bifunctional diaminohydroxyphosphoribosylaminopyrimidine deaminase/5-amino-6-(5-phosphoribosylamino)uracil reductase RibD [Candidatus Riflebacteria bacterium]|nr:bifunctional diaminohydroxyphosphoribosylaminopyrimidine deaminase/5-amino-6-(5-phosphoribosylamino)uracil reductase RibD [Candidatus Riflebacteria bacterium]
MNDNFFMKCALDLARMTLGQTRPNPSVGCVIVKEGRILGMGSHLKSGEPHAEVLALRQSGSESRGATLYVTLEPCAHFGHTPPCVNAIIAAGISRVVVATTDENPLVSGKGIGRLREAGIKVENGLFENDAKQINESFFFFHKNGRPRITLKAAVSLDGRIATRTGHSRWISSESSRQDSHILRRTVDAILVGSGTVVSDNPTLTARFPDGAPQPLRILIDRRLRSSTEANIFNSDAQTLVFTTEASDPNIIGALRNKGVEVVPLKQDFNVPQVISELALRNVRSLLVEGGATIHGAFLDSGIFDEVIFYIAPKLIGGVDAKFSIGGIGAETMASAYSLDFFSVEKIGEDLKIIARPKQPLPKQLPG